MPEWFIRDNGETMLSIANPDRELLDARLIHENREVELTFKDGVEILPYGGGVPDLKLAVRLGIEKHKKLVLLAFHRTKEALSGVLDLEHQSTAAGA